MTPEAVAQGGRSPDRLSTTRWSVVLACADSSAGEETAHKALADLCKIYWRPVFAFICRRGYSVADVQDLTQDFSLLVLEGNLLKRADPSRGRFRSLLLVACLSSAGEMPAGPTAKVAVQLHDQVIRRSSCACIRQGCVGRTRTLKP